MGNINEKKNLRFYMESLWRKQTGKIEASLKENQNQWDVIVIGAGMAGILTAYYLQKKGKDVLVLEANEIASGQTERTTAKITSQHGMKYHKLIKTVGKKKARLYAKANEAAIEEYEKLIDDLGIDCDFKRVPAYLYTTENEKKLNKEGEAAASIGIDVFFESETELPFLIKGAIGFPNQAQFSPLKFVKHIAKEINILEHTKAVDVKGNQVITETQNFTADKIVAATHYPFIDVPGFYFLRQHQERSYVLALSGCNEIEGMYYSLDQEGLSLRQAGKYLLLGGSSHRTGTNKVGGAYELLERAQKHYFPDSEEVTRWSAQDCMTHDGIPFIGKYSNLKSNLYVATGFQKWGMTSSMVAAMILSDEISGIENPYAKLFSPQRIQIRASFMNFLIDVGMSIKGLTKGLFTRKAPRCPHMGCQLVWNPDEKSWDCPCHGSRFEEDGKLLDNPAEIDIK